MTAIENVRLDNMEEKLNTVEDKVDQILTALTGSNLNTGGGLVPEFKNLRDRVLKLENLKNRIIYVSIGAGIAGGFSITKLIEWIQLAAK